MELFVAVVNEFQSIIDIATMNSIIDAAAAAFDHSLYTEILYISLQVLQILNNLQQKIKYQI